MKMIKFKKLVSHKKNQGFTLIELLFATVILGTMITLTMITFIGVFRFYIWSRTTRNNQIAARQVMETMTREIEGSAVIDDSGNADKKRLCLKNTTTGKGKKIGLLSSTNGTEFTFPVGTASNATTIYSQEFVATATGCTTPVGTATAISNPNMKVSKLEFNFINTSINTSYLIANPAQFRESTTIDMTVVNGAVITTGPDSGECKVGDNFCDIAKYSTAVAGQ
ncbi:MAG: type II secretion system protein [Patescibacteria group bacterium]|nr:type II secretion system protein [Patescibacteria group bacterium]